MRTKTNVVIKARAVEMVRRDAGQSGTSEPQVGRLVGFDARGRLLVEVTGLRGKLPARSLLRVDQALRQAVLRRAEVLLLFEAGDRKKPIVAGLLQPNAQDPTPTQITSLAAGGGKQALALEVDADGKRVKLTAQDEIVLACGKASITLRRNGRVIIQGTQVDSVAAGTHRIRGGQVRLN
jgi:hypothetical protein